MSDRSLNASAQLEDGPHLHAHPFPLSLATHNARGLSAHAVGLGGRARASRTRANITKLTNTYDVVYLQETKLLPGASEALRAAAPQHSIYTNSKSSTSAGVAILLSPRVHNHYEITHIPLPPELRGYALCLQLNPLSSGEIDGDALAPILLLNLYLDSRSHTARAQQLRSILASALPTDGINFVAGDFNFVESPEDSTAVAHQSPLPDGFKKVWEEFVTEFRLAAHQQPHLTYHFNAQQIDDYRASNLDRIYSSLSELDYALLNPHAHIAGMPHSLLSGSGDRARLSANSRCSDHLAVGLQHRPTPAANSRRRATIPRWLAEHPDFAPCFIAAWESGDADSDPFQELVRFKKVLFNTATLLKKRFSASRNQQLAALGELDLGLKVLRLHRAGGLTPSIWSRYRRRYSLLARTSDVCGELDAAALRSHLTSLLANDGEVEPPLERAVPSGDRDPQDPRAVGHDDLQVEILPAAPGQAGSAQATGGIDNPTHGPRRKTVLDRIKAIIPSTRTRLPGLRRTMEDDLVTDPDEMASLAGGYWSGVWAERNPSLPFAVQLARAELYCGKKNLCLPPPAPLGPSEAAIAKAIRGAKHSCPGPDGIPFACYKSVVGQAAPVLHQVCMALLEGRPPPGFNHGLLFLLPKKGTHLPADTRPISVTNSDNRLIAKAVVVAITPYLQDVLDHSQQGFIPGRSGGRHIRAINELFYSAVQDPDKKLCSFLLFLDTAKAFDSIDHAFIIAAIKRLDLPEWVVTLVLALLQDVQVSPCFGGAGTELWIRIQRGVKQGCPLSPLLFAICYDALLTRLVRLPGLSNFAFADDLAIGARHFPELHPAMLDIDAFKVVSGLGHNMEKTAVLSARGRPGSLQRLVATSPWPLLCAPPTHPYLGIPLGRKLQLEDIWSPILAKMEGRCLRWSQAFRQMSLARRILTMNVFVLSMLVYVNTYHALAFGEDAESAEARCRRLIRTFVIPGGWARGGGAYSFFQLIQPSTRFGPSPSLRDPWACSIVSLATQTDLSHWDGYSNETMLDYRESREHKQRELSMRIADQQFCAGCDFATCDIYGQYPASEAVFTSATFYPPAKTLQFRRQLMRARLVYAHYHYKEQDPALAKSLAGRGLQVGEGEIATLHANFGSLVAPTQHHNNQFHLTLNALPTDRRLLFRTIPDAAARHAAPPPPCYFCGGGCDSIDHFFGGDCPPVARALDIFATNTKLSLGPGDLGAENTTAAALLLGSGYSAKTVKARVIFNSMVWLQRCSYFYHAPGDPASESQVINRLVEAATVEWHLCTAKRKRASSSKFGAAGRRSPAQTAAALAYVDSILQAIDHVSCVVAYTDGSAIGNPGPSGAGAIITYPHFGPHGGQHTEELSVGLGTGTNNLGEMWAIGMVLQDLDRKVATGYQAPATGYILTDSSYTLGCLTKGWDSKTHPELQQHLLARIAANPTTWHILWVPGHANVALNEAADRAANRGSARSAAGHGLADLPDLIARGVFSPAPHIN
jgi:ribonuclease HI